MRTSNIDCYSYSRLKEITDRHYISEDGKQTTFYLNYTISGDTGADFTIELKMLVRINTAPRIPRPFLRD